MSLALNLSDEKTYTLYPFQDEKIFIYRHTWLFIIIFKIYFILWVGLSAYFLYLRGKIPYVIY